MRSVDEHLAACLAAVAPLAPVELAILDAVGCVLAVDVVASGALPVFDSSAMDGYAVRSADVAGAAPAAPVALPVVGDLPAGSSASLVLPAGAAIRIMTGAPVPEGADAVVPVEATDAGLERVVITAGAAAGQHVRVTGDDVRPGELLVAAGTRLHTRHVALLAAAGVGAVRAHPRPRVAVLSTGDELVEPGLPLGPGQVHDANSTALVAAARAAGALAHRVPTVGDDAGPAGRLMAALLAAAEHADVVITTGGVSAGAYDVVKEVLLAEGGVDFVAVAMQPGKPQGLGVVRGTHGDVPLFTLPGNPVSAVVSFEVFVAPALRRMQQLPEQGRAVEAVAGREWRSAPGKRQFVRGALSAAGGAGERTVVPVGGHGSHLVADLAAADCLVDVPEGVTTVAAGQRLRCLLLEGAS